MSACILTLLNGNNESLELCIIGPGGSPFSDACDDPNINVREGGFFGDLFATHPQRLRRRAPGRAAGHRRARLLRPNRAPTAATRATPPARTTSSSPARCRARTAAATASRRRGPTGEYQYCTSFWTNREPGRTLHARLHDLHPAGLTELTSPGGEPRRRGGRLPVAALEQRVPRERLRQALPRAIERGLLLRRIGLDRCLAQRRAPPAPPAPAESPGPSRAPARPRAGPRRRRGPAAPAAAGSRRSASARWRQTCPSMSQRFARSGTFWTASDASFWARSSASRKGRPCFSAHAACSARSAASSASQSALPGSVR